MSSSIRCSSIHIQKHCCVDDKGIISSKRVAEVSEQLMDLGCYEISLGDTIGIGNPGQATKVTRRVKERVPVDMLAGMSTAILRLLYIVN